LYNLSDELAKHIRDRFNGLSKWQQTRVGFLHHLLAHKNTSSTSCAMPTWAATRSTPSPSRCTKVNRSRPVEERAWTSPEQKDQHLMHHTNPVMLHNLYSDNCTDSLALCRPVSFNSYSFRLPHLPYVSVCRRSGRGLSFSTCRSIDNGEWHLIVAGW